MSNPSSWFGIHAHDLDRAKAFYESVFGKPLQDVGGNGFRFIIFPADYTQHGTAGMIWHDSNAQPGHGGTTIFFNCPDCAETAEKAVAAGGKLLQENSALPTALQHLSKTQKATESVCTAHANPNSHKISHYYYKNLT